jgi:hypothetical protein
VRKKIAGGGRKVGYCLLPAFYLSAFLELGVPLDVSLEFIEQVKFRLQKYKKREVK